MIQIVSFQFVLLPSTYVTKSSNKVYSEILKYLIPEKSRSKGIPWSLLELLDIHMEITKKECRHRLLSFEHVFVSSKFCVES